VRESAPGIGVGVGVAPCAVERGVEEQPKAAAAAAARKAQRSFLFTKPPEGNFDP